MKPTGCLLALAIAAAVAAPGMAQTSAAKTAQKGDRLAVGTLGSFTPNGASRDYSARMSELEQRFSFTPSESAKAEDGEKLTVGVRRRVARTLSQPAPTEPTASRAAAAEEAPASVGASVDVGYAGFSLSGDYNRDEGRVVGSERERVAFGFGYAAKKWRADLRTGTSQPADSNRVVPDAVGEAVSVELGAAYALSPRLAVKGGVRYDRIHPEAFRRDFVNRDADEAKDTGSVYLGTSLSF